MKSFHLELVTPEKTLYSQDVEEVILPTSSGQITILADHEPLITQLVVGEIIVKKNGEQDYLATYGGFIEVADNQVRVLADLAEHAHEINELEVAEAKKRAETAMKEKRSTAEYAQAAAEMERALAREKVAQRKRKRH